MTAPTIHAARLFRCTSCGGWRYFLNRPCQTCTILRNREYLGRA